MKRFNHISYFFCRYEAARVTWNGGLAVQASTDGVTWYGIKYTRPTGASNNLAIVTDGTTCASFNCGP